jgi:GTP-binding protein
VKLLTTEFVTSAAAGDVARDRLPQIAFVGRSNVGKSRLINALCRTTIARTSAAPGKTRLANVYRVTLEGGAGAPGVWSLYFVDLPGYGYGRGGANAANELAGVAEKYLGGARDCARVSGVLLLVDSRHPKLDSDIDAARWLSRLGAELRIVATKIDKLTRAERARNLKTLETTFGMAAAPVSALTGEGLDDLWTMIAKLARNR